MSPQITYTTWTSQSCDSLGRPMYQGTWRLGWLTLAGLGVKLLVSMEKLQ